MDAAFIQQNQIIERYLMGRLPPKGAQDFERWCRANPELVAQMGLSDRINAALRLLDASGEPAPWEEKVLPFYQKPQVIAGIAALAAVLLVTTIVFSLSSHRKDKQILQQEQALRDRPLQALQGTRPIVVEPSRRGPVAGSMVTIGRDRVELADFKFDVSWSQYPNFRVTIDREDQGRVAVLTNLARDSNGHVRVGVNSSLLGAGEYTVEIEGIDWRGAATPQAWARFTAR
jgi:ferric-dicitrate binding protein FerR (iron transport regulator)